MTVRDITVIGNQVLHRRTAPVQEVTDEIRTLVQDMFETMEAARGVGLAANQVGVGLRIFVYDCPDDEGVRHSGHVVNPVLEVSEAPLSADPRSDPHPDDDIEGCLSVPGEAFPTARAPWARVTGTSLDGDPVEIVGTGLFARCLQHEVDHLDGWLYLDRLSGLTKSEARKVVADRGWTKRKILSWDPTAMTADDV